MCIEPSGLQFGVQCTVFSFAQKRAMGLGEVVGVYSILVKMFSLGVSQDIYPTPEPAHEHEGEMNGHRPWRLSNSRQSVVKLSFADCCDLFSF